MSLTTRCPACGTRFRVVADLLKISDGWVRCGHCSAVFDATLDLSEATDPAPAPLPPAASTGPAGHAPPATPPATPPAGAEGSTAAAAAAVPGAPPEAPPAHSAASEPRAERPMPRREAPTETDVPSDADDEIPTLVPPVTDAELEAAFGIEPTPPRGRGSASAPPPEPDFTAELQRFAAERGSDLMPLPGRPAVDAGDGLEAVERVRPSPDPSGDAAEGQPATDAVRDAAADPAADLPEPAFMRQARRQARWRSVPARVALSGVALLAAASLAAQWIHHERDWLAAARPDLKPWLERACEPLGCRIEPLRRIDAVVIDSASLVQRLGQFHSFDFVLKNTAALPLAAPALELTLTDARDQVVARRVFLPQDWPDAPTELPAGGSVSVSLRLAINLGDNASIATAGYRALVFYP